MKSNMDVSTVVIEMKDIVKKFGNFTANDHINLTVHKGEVHAILGENGAGKSTLMNVLYGMYRPTSGQIFINGKEVSIDNPEKAIELGIGMVHQHFMLVQPFTVTENIVLGAEPRKGLTVDLKTARQRIVELSEKYGLMVDPDAKVEDISVGMQQRVEILKVLYRGADLLIFDEPTASLTPQEINELMDIIHNLTAGRQVTNKVNKKEMEPGRVVVEVKDLHAKDYRGVEVLKGLNLEVHAGEILGLAGIDGNGQSQLVEILTGLGKATSGQVLMNGKDVTNETPKMLFDEGISSIPEDRQKHGLVLDFSVAENLVLQNFAVAPYAKNGILQKKVIRDHATDMIRDFDIRPVGCEERLAGQLSGGNQQKVIIAREVTNDKDFLIAFNPTRGLDVGAIEFVHKYLVAQRNKGRAILLVSFELDEIMNLSDRIDVIFDGQIDGEMMGAEADEYKLGLMMAGGKAE